MNGMMYIVIGRWSNVTAFCKLCDLICEKFRPIERIVLNHSIITKLLFALSELELFILIRYLNEIMKLMHESFQLDCICFRESKKRSKLNLLFFRKKQYVAA